MTENSYLAQYKSTKALFDATFLRHLENGVIFLSDSGILIDETVEIATGATIMPGTILRGKTVIGAGSVIGPNSLLQDCKVGCNVVFNASQGYESSIDDGTSIGPFVHIRPNSSIGKKVKIGDFVEIKNSGIDDGSSIAHLTYIGDTDMGRHCNIGCGVVTVNYDGENKSRTTIGDYCFVGCNTNLVAPVVLGDGAYTAAGSTITKDIASGELAIARAHQQNKSGWADSKLRQYKEKRSK